MFWLWLYYFPFQRQDSSWSLHCALYVGRAVREGPKFCLKHELISYQ